MYTATLRACTLTIRTLMFHIRISPYRPDNVTSTTVVRATTTTTVHLHHAEDSATLKRTEREAAVDTTETAGISYRVRHLHRHLRLLLHRLRLCVTKIVGRHVTSTGNAPTAVDIVIMARAGPRAVDKEMENAG